jgi:thiamine pyrophosphate-dependent acetolactate synthase large subunit-like protein
MASIHCRRSGSVLKMKTYVILSLGVSPEVNLIGKLFPKEVQIQIQHNEHKSNKHAELNKVKTGRLSRCEYGEMRKKEKNTKRERERRKKQREREREKERKREKKKTKKQRERKERQKETKRKRKKQRNKERENGNEKMNLLCHIQDQHHHEDEM